MPGQNELVMKHPCLMPCLTYYQIILQFAHIGEDYTERNRKYGADDKDKFILELLELFGHCMLS